MRITTFPISVLSAFTLVLLLAAQAARGGEALDLYVEMTTGSFSSAAQAAADDRYGTAVWHIAEVWDGRDDGRWLYAENWFGEAERPYRQRITRLTVAEDGSLLARGYRLPETQRYVGAWKDPSLLEGLSPDDLQPVEGCDVTLVRAGERRFEGNTHGRECRNGYKGAAYVVSRSVLTDEIMMNWDRGIAADGRVVWGPEAGGYRFHPVDDGDSTEACNKPVRMVVFGEIHDREAFAAYPRAIFASGLYEKVQGYYEAITPALEVFEGDPPPGRGVVISRFPCLEAAREFWYSDTYQNEILPLREGAADFEVLVLPGLPVPDYIEPGYIE
ncbi:CpcT/CpeT family chromophore lyase [Lentisalinibacter salinarum]|uniref:CpcT/CpeT family chromophore lyase n=1 Tax=Lentisalinibacter salinarum TaxID=2992239 RepID=UPI0038667BCE